jgi:Ca2+-binding RTX toxin-like protein
MGESTTSFTLAFTTVRSATGVDFIGTPGVDVGVIFDETGKVVATGLGDADIITIFNSTGIQRTTTLNGIDGADTINVNTSISESSINGNKGADTIQLSSVVANCFVGGGDGADIISGGSQWLSSLFHGGAGNDTIFAPSILAISTIMGYSGNDVIDLSSGSLNTISINGNEGDDNINGSGISVALSGTNFFGGGAGNDTINFTNANNIVSAMGFDLTGGSGNDVITGSNDNDTIWGNADNDTISGGPGTDTIYAGAGNDRINAEFDKITGGLGADDYVLVPGPGTSTFFINAVGESAAATSGTARTFDSFVPYSGFVPGDILNISAVTNQLAGGPYTGGATAATSTNLGVVGAFANFADLQTNLNLGNYLASSTGTIRTYTFNATIAGTAGNYLWIQDSQSAYASSDLLFQTTNLGSIPVGQIVLV